MHGWHHLTQQVQARFFSSYLNQLLGGSKDMLFSAARIGPARLRLPLETKLALTPRYGKLLSAWRWTGGLHRYSMVSVGSSRLCLKSYTLASLLPILV